MKKRVFALCLTAAAAASLTACGGGADSPAQNTANGGSNELYVYNWGEYIDESVIEQFEEETGISVIYDLFETNVKCIPLSRLALSIMMLSVLLIT